MGFVLFSEGEGEGRVFKTLMYFVILGRENPCVNKTKKKHHKKLLKKLSFTSVFILIYCFKKPTPLPSFYSAPGLDNSKISKKCPKAVFGALATTSTTSPPSFFNSNSGKIFTVSMTPWAAAFLIPVRKKEK